MLLLLLLLLYTYNTCRVDTSRIGNAIRRDIRPVGLATNHGRRRSPSTCVRSADKIRSGTTMDNGHGSRVGPVRIYIFYFFFLSLLHI